MSLYLNDKKYAGRGLSAYDQAVIGGYTGSSSEFSSSLAKLPQIVSSIKASTLSNNSFYVPKDITSWYENGMLWTKINQGCIDLYPGMTFDVTGRLLYKSTAQNTHKMLIMGVNSAKDVHENHIICCPYSNFGQAKYFENFSSSNTGFANSYLFTNVIGGVVNSVQNITTNSTVNQRLFNIFKNHLLTYSSGGSSSVNKELPARDGSRLSGQSSSIRSYLVQADCMTEREVLGCIAFSSSGIDSYYSFNYLPAFRLNPKLTLNDTFWIKDVASEQSQCVIENGNSWAYEAAMDPEFSLKPKFILVG